MNRGAEIGKAVNTADISKATFRLPESLKDWRVYIDGETLRVAGYKENTVAIIGDVEYESLKAAIEGSTEETVIKLIKDETAATTVNKNAYLDLNGHNVTGTVTVNGTVTLYCMDSQTDDYTIYDEAGYGKITSFSGNIDGIPEESELASDGYLKVTEGKEGISFHRVNLRLKAISLRPIEKGICAPSVYYKCNFMGDEMVAGAVESYGVALSVQEMPYSGNMDSKCEYSIFNTFVPGAKGNLGNGTLLYGIMKPENKSLINHRNANIPVFGRAYIQTESGFMFGKGYNRTLKEVVETTDSRWDQLTDSQRNNMIQMYAQYSSVMRSWDLPNLKEPAKSDDALKVLVIGNSHGLDATNLLYEVFKD